MLCCRVYGINHSLRCEVLTLKVLVATIDALGHFETGQVQHSAMPEHKGFKLQ